MLSHIENFERVGPTGGSVVVADRSRILCERLLSDTGRRSLFFHISMVRFVCVRVLFTRTHEVGIESIFAEISLFSMVYTGYRRFCVHILFTHASLGGVFTPCSHSELEGCIGGGYSD